jgi:spore coat polysaccharide biosynthesis predicted glycosyltransferase SpsG|tara:strand:+ start:948 stop:1076 length:129 start_codon:yes stop_codon:yes gene_type:complete
MNILIRTDASIIIGTGHILRYMALAQRWKNQDGDALCIVLRK